MNFGLRIALLLLLVSGTVTVKGSDLSDVDPGHGAAGQRAKRGFSVYDFLRGKGTTSVGPKPTKPTERITQTSKPAGGGGFNLDDALLPGPQPSKPAGRGDTGFHLEDALRPAFKPTDEPTGECQGNLFQKLSTVIENQNEELKMLMKLVARMN